MKIAFIGQKGIPAHSGGVERHVDDIATRLAAEGHEAIVYCRGRYARTYEVLPPEYAHIRLIAIPTIKSKNFEAIIQTLLATIHALFVRDLDIIHYHGIGPSLCAWIPRLLKPGTRVIVTFHSQDYESQKWKPLAQLAFRAGEAIACRVAHEMICVSKGLGRYVKRVYGLNAEVIPNAVAPQTAGSPTLLVDFGLSPHSYILCVSRLVPHKRIQDAITAYLQLPADLQARFKLALVGSEPHTLDYQSQLRRAVHGSENILFLGEVSGERLSSLINHASIFVQASESEGLSYTLLEALMAGVPVLVSDIAAHREVLLSDEATFPVRDSGALGAKLFSILLDDGPARLLARRHRDHVVERYRLDRVFPKILGL